jgi:hypothetical protein
MVQSRETLEVKNDDDPKPRVFITLKFRVKFTLNQEPKIGSGIFLSPRHGIVEMNI